MAVWGLYGAKRHMSSIWVAKLGGIILKQIEATENIAQGAIRKIAKAGFQSLQGLYKMYQWVQAPMNAALALTHRAHDSGPASDSDHDPTAASSSQPLPITDPRRRIGIRGKKSDQAAANEGIAVPPTAPAAVPRRLPAKQQNARSAQYREVPGFQGGGQQALKTQAPLVNYGAGVRQMRRGGGKTIKAMAPILEFNEAADDPYVMRQQVH